MATWWRSSQSHSQSCSATSYNLVTVSEEAPSRLIIPDTHHFRLPRTPITGAKEGFLILGKKPLTVLWTASAAVLQFCLACPISDDLYNFSELRGAVRAARLCSPARAPTSVPPHPAIDFDATVYLVGFWKAKSRHLITERRKPFHRQRTYRGHHGPRENLEASL